MNFTNDELHKLKQILNLFKKTNALDTLIQGSNMNEEEIERIAQATEEVTTALQNIKLKYGVTITKPTIKLVVVV
jgi:wyosine [tRNA(Phe)-imidazoG37] synthetase (radical SAM superfamily)